MDKYANLMGRERESERERERERGQAVSNVTSLLGREVIL